jgi:hypothetical protein
MSTYVWCELVCDHCSQNICGEFSSSARIPRDSLKKEACEKGAVFDGDDVFCCGDHYAAARLGSTKLSANAEHEAKP